MVVWIDSLGLPTRVLGVGQSREGYYISLDSHTVRWLLNGA
jgi:hypothetical protein